MRRIARRLGLFVGVAFVVLLALQLAFEVPPLPFALSGTRVEQAQVYAAMYVGFAAGSSRSIVKTLIPGVVGAGLGFLFLPRGQPLRAGAVIASGGMFALATFLLDAPVTRSIGEVPWLVCIVVLAAFITQLSGRAALRHVA